MNTTQKTPAEFDLAAFLAATDQDDLTDRTHQTVTVYRRPALVDEAVGRVAALEHDQVGGESAIGETVDQAAYQLHIDKRTVRYHLVRLRDRLKARTNAELLARAVALGLVRPELDDLFD